MLTHAAESEHTRQTEPTGTETAREIVRRLFSGVDAPLDVSLEDGTALLQHPQPKAAIILREPSVLRALLTRSSDLEAGEAVVRGDIVVNGDVEAAFGIMDDVAAARETQEWPALVALALRLPASKASQAEPPRVRPKLRGRLHSLERDRAAIAHHYDVSNEFYALWLDRSMTYSCAYFRDPSVTLDDAQLDKYELICRKLRLQQNERFLDIGCGWGGLIRFAAREYGVSAVGITLSLRQAEFARERIAEEQLDKCCRVELKDYRDLQALGEFNKAASVGMVEHVGDAMLLKYFESVYAALAPGGIFLNHGIISQKPKVSGLRAIAGRFFPQRSRFIETYVFPDGELPRLPEMTQAAQDAGFEVRDVENLREHYTQTLRHWVQRLEKQEQEARRLVGDATYNIWRFYIAGSAHAFNVGRIAVVQQLLAKRHADGTADVPMTRADIYH